MKKQQKIIAAVFIALLLIFEFLIPSNRFIPKPSLIYHSCIDLFTEYKIFLNLTNTISVIYLPALFAFVFFYIFFQILSNENPLSLFIYSTDWIVKYIPSIILGLIMILWFPESRIIEYIFSFLICFFPLFTKINKRLKEIPEEYIHSAVSLGYTSTEISRKIELPFVMPDLIRTFRKIHIYHWSMILIFEYFQKLFGLGAIINQLIFYKDLSGLFALIFLLWLIVFVISKALLFIEYKFFFWKEEF
ncbi:MAG: hypothetical protein HXY48_04620 [Ignavibacteriaceae bacterium]|nr:hypothetical protein [Ignavibacteriaceae bacterium]